MDQHDTLMRWPLSLAARAGVWMSVMASGSARWSPELSPSGGRSISSSTTPAIGIAGEIHELTDAHWNRMLDVNLRGVVNGVMAAYPLMVRQRSGHIVNVASLGGLGPTAFAVPYTASKHAVVGLSTSLRCEAADYGVRVSVLCPSAIETPLLDRGNPVDLPAVWRPNMRRFFTPLLGDPYPPERFARASLDAVAANTAVIVIPGRACIAWRIGQLAPGMAAPRLRSPTFGRITSR